MSWKHMVVGLLLIISGFSFDIMIMWLYEQNKPPIGPTIAYTLWGIILILSGIPFLVYAIYRYLGSQSNHKSIDST
jgi:hypothetical protein